MNDSNIAHDVRMLITNHTDQSFCPPNTEWVQCDTIHYLPHSNECGPRTILALNLFAIHPHPHKQMLLPFMHSNIAQISRKWIALSLLQGIILDDNFYDHLDHNSNILPSTLTATSIPLDFIKWSNIDSPATMNWSNNTDKQKFTLPKNICNIQETSERMSDQLTPVEPINDTGCEERQLTQSALHKTKMEKSNEMNSHLTQTLIHQWINPTHAPDNNHDETNDNIFDPFGTPLSPVDPTATLRIIMQNPQYALQLTNENAPLIQTILNLKQLEVSIFVVISPNINWCNKSNWITFKRLFKKQYQQLHISAISSDIGYDQQYDK
jgi:hypothetical protein